MILQLLAIELKCLSATDTKETRIKLTSPLLKESKTLNFDYKYNSHIEQAIDYLQDDLGLKIHSFCQFKDDIILNVFPKDSSFRFLK